MTVTDMSRCESRVTTPLRHKGCHTTPTRPDPTHPFTTYDSIHLQTPRAELGGEWMAADAAGVVR